MNFPTSFSDYAVERELLERFEPEACAKAAACVANAHSRGQTKEAASATQPRFARFLKLGGAITVLLPTYSAAHPNCAATFSKVAPMLCQQPASAAAACEIERHCAGQLMRVQFRQSFELCTMSAAELERVAAVALSGAEWELEKLAQLFAEEQQLWLLYISAAQERPMTLPERASFLPLAGAAALHRAFWSAFDDFLSSA